MLLDRYFQFATDKKGKLTDIIGLGLKYLTLDRNTQLKD